MKYVKRIALLAIAILLLVNALPFNAVQAAALHTVTFVDVNGTAIDTATINSGSAIDTLPNVPDLYIWVDSAGNTVDDTTVPTSDMTVTAVKNADISSSGTMDGGNLKWFITNGKLYVTGRGTIGSIPVYNSVNSTKVYGLALGNIEITNPSTKYEWLAAPAVGDEQNGGYSVDAIAPSASTTLSLNISRPVRFDGQTISYPHATAADYAPWLANAAEITDMIFAESVSLSGNFSLYFNLNSTSISPSKLQPSVYTNLKNIYLYADTSAVTQMSGMFAYIPNLENIYTISGKDFDTSACVDMSGMFYADEKLTVNAGTYEQLNLESIINNFKDTSSVYDMRYMFFDCKNIVQPSIGAWDTSSLTDASYMFTGCNSAKLTLSGTGNAYDLAGWDMSHVYSTTAMFAGSDIDMNTANPLANLWGATTSQVITGNVNLDLWDLSKLQVSVFMLAQNHGISEIQWTSSVPKLIDSSAMCAFNDSLLVVNFQNLSMPLLTYSDVMFFNAGAKNGELNATGWDISNLSEAQYMFYGTGFEKIILDNTNPSSLTNASGMFYENKLLTSLGAQGVSDWTLSELTDASYMFYGNKLLQDLDVSNFEMSNAQDISYMLAECPSLLELNLNWKIGPALKNMDGFLYNDANIASLNLSSWNATGLERGYAAFANMSSLSTIDVSGLKCDSLVIANGMFANDFVLKSVDFGNTSAPNLLDAGGMFSNDALLTTVTMPSFIGSNTENVSYMFSGCTNLADLDISGWNTSNVEYFQSFLDGAIKLKSINVGVNFKTSSALSTATMFRNNNLLSNNSLQSVLNKFSAKKLESTYNMFAGVKNLKKVDFGKVDFSSVKDYTGMFYGADALIEFTLSDSFLSNATSAADVFYVDTDTNTVINVVSSGTIVPNKLSSYDWETDHRVFLKNKGIYINDKETNTYIFTTTTPKVATLKFNAESTFSLNGSPLSLDYSWFNGTTDLSNNKNIYDATKTSVGTITAIADISILKHSTPISATFNLTNNTGITGMTATYIGNPIVVGSEYSLDDVKVTVTAADGSTTTLSSNEFTVNNRKVDKRGDNRYTATYKDSDGNTLTAGFTVKGYRKIGFIEAEYTGPAIEVGKEYSLEHVSLTAYYSDDTDKTTGFFVKPSSVSATKVTSAGDNTFTAYYIDTENGNNTLSDDFVVRGKNLKSISSISASYNGKNIVVGNNYNKDDVIVTVKYTDETTETTKEFSTSSMTVNKEGNNTYIATVVDSNGKVFTAPFNIMGVRTVASDITSITAKYVGEKIKVGSNYSTKDVEVVAHYANGNSSKISDFTVNSTKVTAVGDNIFTASVKDSDGAVYTATFTVLGWGLDNIESIEAVYKGPTILVGNNYNKDNVIVTIRFSDGAAPMVTTDFTVNSTFVGSEGVNSYNASLKDSNGLIWTTSFSVRGTVNVKEAAKSAENVLGVKTGDSNDVLGIVMIISGLIILLVVFLILRINPKKH